MNRQKFETFVREEYRGLVTLAQTVAHNREDAEDAVQNALVYAWQKLSGGKWEGPRPVTASYLRQLIVNNAKMILRSYRDRSLDNLQEVILNKVYGVSAANGRRVLPKKGRD